MSSTMDRLKKRATATQTGAEREVLIPLDKLKFDPTQPRKAFHALDGRIAEKDQQYIEELAQTIKENGLIQAITVQEQADGTYLVVVGECRTRAHLLLGLPTIRATVRNDLTNPSRRLIYQIAENVSRQDLTDEELALSIKLLLEGGNDGKPMTQAAVAAQLGKSEGWVSRFVKFGDEELQRVWVKSGIADSVEKVYRLSILPKPVQMDILARVELPEGDPQRLEKPLNRNVIDELAKQAKIEKARDAIRGARAESEPAPFIPPMPENGNHQEAGGRVVGDNAIDLAIQEAVSEGNPRVAGGENAASFAEQPTSATGYALSDSDRTKLLSGDLVESDSVATMSSKDMRQDPVHCRVSIRNLEGLLELLKTIGEDDDTLDATRSLRCDLIIPGAVAGQIANRMVGVIVDEREISAVVQSGLVKLGH